MNYPPEVIDSAHKHLQMVIEATGATFCGYHGVSGVEIQTTKGKFFVTHGAVLDYSRQMETCWVHQPMPPDEAIASVLLLLKSNPCIFDKWVARVGYVCS